MLRIFCNVPVTFEVLPSLAAAAPAVAAATDGDDTPVVLRLLLPGTDSVSFEERPRVLTLDGFLEPLGVRMPEAEVEPEVGWAGPLKVEVEEVAGLPGLVYGEFGMGLVGVNIPSSGTSLRLLILISIETASPSSAAL